MGRTDRDARRHQTAAGPGGMAAVAADVESVRDFSRLDGIAVTVAGHAGSGDDVFVGALGQHRIDEHGLGLGAVKGFADQGVTGKERNGVFRRNFHVIRADL